MEIEFEQKFKQVLAVKPVPAYVSPVWTGKTWRNMEILKNGIPRE